MKKIILVLSLIACAILPAQTTPESTDNQVYVKANAVFLPIGMLNAAAEFQVSEKTTLQPEIFISPWKSFLGKYAQMYMLGFDVRHYFSEAFKHFYVGANVTASRYKMQKYNYWTDAPYQYEPDAPIYVTSELYQDGYTFFLGAVAGYQWQISDKWNIDAFLGGGTAQSFYKGFHKVLGVRYDTDPDREYNRSGELVPYRGGLMISYKIR